MDLDMRLKCLELALRLGGDPREAVALAGKFADFVLENVKPRSPLPSSTTQIRRKHPIGLSLNDRPAAEVDVLFVVSRDSKKQCIGNGFARIASNGNIRLIGHDIRS
jgi:hypothetical protein